MANSNNRYSKGRQDGYVDISSSSQVKKAYGKKKKTKTKRVVTLILSIVLLLTGSVMVYYYRTLDLINYQDVDKNDKKDTTSTNANTVSADSLLSDENVLNILLYGEDGHDDGTFGRSDTTILVSIDNTHKKIKMVSFLRDTYVYIPGYGEDRINAAFSYGGVKLSIQTIEANFGIAIDKYAMVDFVSFRKVIDALGGVEIELTRDEIGYINAQIDYNKQWSKTDYVPDNGEEKQKVKLNGRQALWYARDRGGEFNGVIYSGSDWDRTTRQRNLLNTIINDLKSASLTELVKIVNEVGPLVTTNLKKDDITFLVQNALTYLNYGIEQMAIPIDGYWKYSETQDEKSVIEITDWDATRSELAKFIYEESVQTETVPVTSQPSAILD